MLLGAAGGALVIGGCEGVDTKRAAQTESIFGLFSPPKPAEAAAWSQDPFDDDKRYRGTNLLANAPFGGEEIYVRMYASKLGAPPATAPDADPGVRGIAARALGMHGDPVHAELIAPLLKEPNKNVRLEAARALQRLHNPKIVEAMLPLLQQRVESEQDVRAEIATGLGQYAEPRVVTALIAALDDDSFLVTRSARRALDTLTGKDFAEDTKAWLAWMSSTDAPFAGRKPFLYPVFERDNFWWEYLPFIPPAPNELQASPVGMRPDGSTDVAARRVPLAATVVSSGAPPVAAPMATQAAAQAGGQAGVQGGAQPGTQPAGQPAGGSPSQAASNPKVELVPNDRMPANAPAPGPTVRPTASAPGATAPTSQTPLPGAAPSGSGSVLDSGPATKPVKPAPAPAPSPTPAPTPPPPAPAPAPSPAPPPPPAPTPTPPAAAPTPAPAPGPTPATPPAPPAPPAPAPPANPFRPGKPIERP